MYWQFQSLEEIRFFVHHTLRTNQHHAKIIHKTFILFIMQHWANNPLLIKWCNLSNKSWLWQLKHDRHLQDYLTKYIYFTVLMHQIRPLASLWATWEPKICLADSSNNESNVNISLTLSQCQFRACLLSLAQSKLRPCSANQRPGYWINLPCDWPSTAWASS